MKATLQNTTTITTNDGRTFDFGDDIVPDRTSRFAQDPTQFLLSDDEPILTLNEEVEWDGLQYDGSKDTCSSGCNEPHSGKIVAFDWNDPRCSYYFQSDKRDQCCGNVWLKAANLERTQPTQLTPSVEKALALRAGLRNQALTYAQMVSQTEELTRALLVEARQGSSVARGVCSACYSDVQFVSGTWKHDDDRECSTPAVLLSH